VRRGLLDAQGGLCLYTGKALAASAAVDHVLPWARVKISTLGNFLLTDGSTNSRKRDLLLARGPVEQWLNHMTKKKAALEALEKFHNWPFEMASVVRSARALYGAVAPGTVLWSAKETRAASQQELDAIRGLLADAA
jgi:hypothetical protein